MSAADLVAVVSDPFTVDFGDGRVAVLSDLSAAGGVLTATVAFFVDGAERPFSNPWRIVDPPGATEDDFREIVTSSWFFRG